MDMQMNTIFLIELKNFNRLKLGDEIYRNNISIIFFCTLYFLLPVLNELVKYLVDIDANTDQLHNKIIKHIEQVELTNNI